jgi:transcriptional regulator with XRE-family HTH domain
MTTKHETNIEQKNKLEIYLGKRLRSLRKQFGWSLMELGGHVGVSHHQIHKYELAQTRISAAKLYVFSKLFGIQADQFFEGYQS